MDCLQYFRVTQSYNITSISGKTYRIDSVIEKNYGLHRFLLHGEAPVTHRLEQK